MEFQFRSRYQFDVLRSRNRSRANVTLGLRCTLNPDKNHFVYDWVKPFLDEDGFPIRELGGKTRYYVIVDDVLYTDWDKDSLKARFGKNPKTYTYIPSLLSDNPHLNEDYADTLDSQSENKRRQLLLGCWNLVEGGGVYFKREWLRNVSHVPMGSVSVRAYDLAGSVPSPAYPNPDYTASIRMWKDKADQIYITGDYVPEFKDDESTVHGRFRKTAGDRDNIMLKQAISDGVETSIILPEDVGSSGKDAFQLKVKFFAEHGFRVYKDSSAKNSSKLVKFEPFCAMAENGMINIVESSFPNSETLEHFLRELELFDNTRSTTHRKDDLVDATATAFNHLIKTKTRPILNFGTVTDSTTASRVLTDYHKITNK